jgi:hypothetical protein
MSEPPDFARLREIIRSRDRTYFEDDCVCVPAHRSYDGHDHKCAMHADIQWAERALDGILDNLREANSDALKDQA